MNSKLTVVVALLLIFAACNAKFYSRDGEQSRILPRLDSPAVPTCGGCVITKDTPLQDLFATLKDFGPTMEKTLTVVRTMFGTNITNVNDMQAHVKKILQDGKAALSAYFSKLSAASANITSCPALKTALAKLTAGLVALIDEYIQYAPTFVAGVDPPSVMDAYRKTLVYCAPKKIYIVTDIIYSTIQVSGSALCPAIGPVFQVAFDPNGILMQQTAKFLYNGGSAATTIVALLSGGFIPGGKIGGPLDQFEVLKQTVCGLLTTVLVDSDLDEKTGGYCPRGSFDPLNAIVGICCALLDVIDPKGGDGSCPADSSGGEGSGQQGGLIGLLCTLLNIVGLCKGGLSSSNTVQSFTALICRIVTAIGGAGLPICISG